AFLGLGLLSLPRRGFGLGPLFIGSAPRGVLLLALGLCRCTLFDLGLLPLPCCGFRLGSLFVGSAPRRVLLLAPGLCCCTLFGLGLLLLPRRGFGFGPLFVGGASCFGLLSLCSLGFRLVFLGALSGSFRPGALFGRATLSILLRRCVGNA